MLDVVTFKPPTTVHTNHLEDYPEVGCLYEPKHEGRNKINTSD